MGRPWRVMEDAFRCILARLPSPARELHPDNSSEFFHDHLHRFWQVYEPAVSLSRSRLYHKDDNRFVEERNRTLVRAFLGQDRLDSVAQTPFQRLCATSALLPEHRAQLEAFRLVTFSFERTTARVTISFDLTLTGRNQVEEGPSVL